MSDTDAGKDKLFAELVLSSERRGELRTYHDLLDGAGVLEHAADETEVSEPELSAHYMRKARQLRDRAQELHPGPDEAELAERARQLETEARQHRDCSCHDNHPARPFLLSAAPPVPPIIKLILPGGRTIWFGSYTIMVDTRDGAITMTINDIVQED